MLTRGPEWLAGLIFLCVFFFLNTSKQLNYVWFSFWNSRRGWTYEKWTAMLTSHWSWIWLHSAQHPARYDIITVVLKSIERTWNEPLLCQSRSAGISLTMLKVSVCLGCSFWNEYHWFRLFLLFFSFSFFVRTPVSVSSTACMVLWSTVALCGGATTPHMSKCVPHRGKQNSTTRTCQVRLRFSGATKRHSVHLCVYVLFMKAVSL